MDRELASVLEENPVTVERLREQLFSVFRIVPFVGAGVSVPFGFPGWGQFLQELGDPLALRNEVDALLAHQDYEGAADLFLQRFDPSWFQGQVSSRFGRHAFGPDRISGLVTLLPELTAGPVVTTNFDPLIERAYVQAEKPLKVLHGGSIDSVVKALALTESFLLKIHGDAEERNGRVLTRQDYDAAYGAIGEGPAFEQRALPGLLLRLMLGQTPLLFLGCSLVKDRTLDVLERAHRVSGFTLVHYAFLQKPHNEAELGSRLQFLSRHGINPIWYRPDAHRVIEGVLRNLLEARRVSEGGARERTTAATEVQARVEGRIETLTRLFVGREQELQVLDDHARAQPRHALVVTAEPGRGKSALLAAWVERRRTRGDRIATHFFSGRDGLTSPSEAFGNLTRQIDQLAGRESHSASQGSGRDALYRALVDWASSGAGPLTVVIDALDEAEDGMRRPGPARLPEGIVLVVAGRAAADETPPDLAEWLEEAQRYPLGVLSKADVGSWLRGAGVSALEAAVDDALVEGVMRATGGEALHLGYLIEEMARQAARGVQPVGIAQGTPQGFEKYVDEQLRDLLRDRRALGATRPKRVFALLCAVLGPIPDQDLQAVSGASALELPWRVSRWFSSRREADGVITHRFGHERCARLFAERLSASVLAMNQALLRHCRRWSANGSRYAMRHYADHLAQAGARNELEALARDPRFRTAQLNAFPDAPEILLRPIEQSLLLALDQEDTVTAAEMLVRAADAASAITSQQSPLIAARAGAIERARALANLHAPEDRVLWLLLLCWELADSARTAAAQDVLHRLASGPVTSLHGWRGKLALLLLAETRSLDREAFKRLVRKMLVYDQRTVSLHDPDPEVSDLVDVLVDREDFDAAKEIVVMIPPIRRSGFGRLARALAGLGRSSEVDSLTVSTLFAPRNPKPEWYLDLARAALERGQEEGAATWLQSAVNLMPEDDGRPYVDSLHASRVAIEIALGRCTAGEASGRVRDPGNRAFALAEAARLVAALGRDGVGLRAGAEETMGGITAKGARVLALRRVARTCLRDDPERARRLVEDAVARAAQITEAEWKDGNYLSDAPATWSDLALLRAELRDIEEAVELLRRIPNSYWHLAREAMAEIAAMVTRRDGPDRALTLLHDFWDEGRRGVSPPAFWQEAQSLIPTLRAVSESGHAPRARDLAATLLGDRRTNKPDELLDRTLGGLTEILVSAGRLEEALSVAYRIGEDFKRRFWQAEVAAAHARRADFAMARQILAAVDDSAGVLRDPVLAAAADALAARGDIGAAEGVLAEMRWGTTEWLTANAAIAAAYAAAHGAAKARERLEELGSGETSARALAGVTAALGPDQAIEPLVDFAESIRAPLERVIAWASLGRGFARRNDRPAAQRAFARAETEAVAAEAHARRDDTHTSRSESRPWLELAIALHGAGLPAEGDRTFDKANSAARYEQYWDDNQLDLARALAADARVERAFMAAKEIELFATKAAALSAVARSGHAAPVGFVEYVEDQWRNLQDRSGLVPWVAQLWAATGEARRLHKVIAERPADPQTAYALCGALGRLHPERAMEIATVLVALAGREGSTGRNSCSGEDERPRSR